MTHPIENQYHADDLLERIFGALVVCGKNPYQLTVDDLAPVDEFHSRGRQSSEELALLVEPTPHDRVLDVGCGLGGSARFLAQKFGCRVLGLDLTPEYIRVARRLTELVKLDDRCSWVVGDGVALPFEDQSFDIVWSEHAQMNIPDKPLLYREIARVLKPAGRFAFHDVFAGAASPTFPLPWANKASLSFLVDQQQARQFLTAAGLQPVVWEQKDAQSVTAFQRSIKKAESGPMPPLGLHLLMGETAKQKMTNYLKSLQENSVTVAMGVAIRQAPLKKPSG